MTNLTIYWNTTDGFEYAICESGIYRRRSFFEEWEKGEWDWEHQMYFKK